MRMRTAILLAALAGLGLGAGCRRSTYLIKPTPYNALYMERLAESTEYTRMPDDDESGGRGYWNTQSRIERTFHRHRADILAPLVPYWRTWDGDEYPQARIDVVGQAVPGNPDQYVYHVGFKGTIEPRPDFAETGPYARLDDYRTGYVTWDRRKDRVVGWEIQGISGGAVPREAVEMAEAVAAAHDERYADLKPSEWVRWLPADYMRKQVFGGPEHRPTNLPEEQAAITEDTGHNLIRLTYTLPHDPSLGPRKKTVHYVYVDVILGRVVGVHESTETAGPDF
jgi:hypothetical protein